MRPSARELIEGVADSLRSRIAPLVADEPWAASELRSIDALLAHLAERVEHEAACLHADNADVGDVLVGLVASLDELRGIVDPVLDQPDPDPLDVAALHERNVALHTVLEEAIHVVHARGTAEVTVVREYLRRAAARERVLYAPLTAGAMF